MPRTFNIAGPNRPEIHYTLDPEPRLPELRGLIERQEYFVLHAPRQTGKTTLMDALARKLTAEGRYTALHFSIEASRPFKHDVKTAIASALDSLCVTAASLLPEPLRPPEEVLRHPPEPTSGLYHGLHAWTQKSPRPIVLFIDEIDTIAEEALMAILHQLRNGYKVRPHGFPQCIGLIGLRDVREYRVRLRPERGSLGSSSPFNIKAKSLTLQNFTAAEVAALYGQHTVETGQRCTPEALALAFDLTRGQPWLVNALAREVIDEQAPDRSVAIAPEHLEAAKEALILRRDTHLDSLADLLRERRVRRIIEPVLTGALVDADVYDDDLVFVADLGLVTGPPGPIVIANPIYSEVIPRALTFVMQSTLPIERQWYILPDGRLDVVKLLGEFQQFFRQHSESWLVRYEYEEAGPHLVLYAWLSRVVNGGGHLSRESAVGTGRADLIVEWPVTTDASLRRWPIAPRVEVQREVIEVKVYQDASTEEKGLAQLGTYLARLEGAAGHLFIFDRRPGRSWEEKVYRRDHVKLPPPAAGRQVCVWGA